MSTIPVSYPPGNFHRKISASALSSAIELVTAGGKTISEVIKICHLEIGREGLRLQIARHVGSGMRELHTAEWYANRLGNPELGDPAIFAGIVEAWKSSHSRLAKKLGITTRYLVILGRLHNVQLPAKSPAKHKTMVPLVCANPSCRKEFSISVMELNSRTRTSHPARSQSPAPAKEDLCCSQKCNGQRKHFLALQRRTLRTMREAS